MRIIGHTLSLLVLLVIVVCDGFSPQRLSSSVAASRRSAFARKASAAVQTLRASYDVDGDGEPATTARQSSRRGVLRQVLAGGGAILSSSFFVVGGAGIPQPAEARLDPVNRPDLLPSQPGQNVIQTEKILTSGQAKRMNDLLTALERDTGFRIRVVCQNYPNTPGLALKDYWDVSREGQKDDKYVVMVVDQFGGSANILNFNVGEGVDLNLPPAFFRRLQSQYGNKFYVRDNGMDLAVTNAIEAIVTCLRSEDQYCVDVPAAAPSMKSLGI